jgi:hypothetical protein
MSREEWNGKPGIIERATAHKTAGGLPALRSVLSLDIVDGSVRFGKYQNWKVCPEQPLPGTLLLYPVMAVAKVRELFLPLSAPQIFRR